MTAEWGAKFALSTMIGIGEDGQDKISKEATRLQAFWAPFLLLHLGGPNTIVVYSLEDNDLWLRSCLAMIAHAGVAVYIFFSHWNNDLLGCLSIPSSLLELSSM